MLRALVFGCLMLSLSTGSSLSQEMPPVAAAPREGAGHSAVKAGDQASEQEGREGGPRWQYQSEQTNPRTYTQPAYGPSIAIEVEQLRNRVASLEDRTEKLEVMLGKAINTINMQTDALIAMGGGQKMQIQVGR